MPNLLLDMKRSACPVDKGTFLILCHPLCRGLILGIFLCYVLGIVEKKGNLCTSLIILGRECGVGCGEKSMCNQICRFTERKAKSGFLLFTNIGEEVVDIP